MLLICACDCRGSAAPAGSSAHKLGARALHVSANTWVLAVALNVWRFFPILIRPRIDQAIGNPAIVVMPCVLLTLYAACIALAWQHQSALALRLSSSRSISHWR